LNKLLIANNKMVLQYFPAFIMPFFVEKNSYDALFDQGKTRFKAPKSH
jgi:hypothetical protein